MTVHDNKTALQGSIETGDLHFLGMKVCVVWVLVWVGGLLVWLSWQPVAMALHPYFQQ